MQTLSRDHVVLYSAKSNLSVPMCQRLLTH